jgi:hypothetical protein
LVISEQILGFLLAAGKNIRDVVSLRRGMQVVTRFYGQFVASNPEILGEIIGTQIRTLENFSARGLLDNEMVLQYVQCMS